MLTYREWKNDADLTIGGQYHIDDELFLISKSDLIRVEAGPFIADRVISIILKKGSMNLTVDMKEYKAEAPCMVVILSKQTFRLDHYSEDLDGSTIMMSSQFLEGLFNEYSTFSTIRRQIGVNPITDLSGQLEGAFNKYLGLMEDLVKSDKMPFRMEVAKHLTLAMFYGVVFSIHNLDDVKPRNRQSELFQKFETELKAHYREEREVNYYSDKLCISAKYLSAVVLEQTGKSARTIISEYAVNECQALLLSTDLTIQQISTKMNFPSQDGFCKFFKRMTGLSPREYRKQIQK